MSQKARLGIALAALVAAAPAGAIDLTGTWEGSYTCVQFDGSTQKVKQKDSVLLVYQEGATFVAAIDGLQSYRGATRDETTDPGKRGEAILNSCGIDPLPLDGPEGELLHFKAKVDAEKGTGTLSGTSIYEGGSVLMTCKLKYKRTNTTPAKFAPCPKA